MDQCHRRTHGRACVRLDTVVMAELPEGTVTFLFSDVEGSTQLLEQHGALAGDALARHHALFEELVERHGGAIFETVGDAVYAAFASPAQAVAAALEVQRALAAEDWGPIGRLAVRISIHTGEVERRGDHYFGSALFRAARLQAVGYGEQAVLSGVTARLVEDRLPDGASLRDLGRHRLKDLAEPEQVHQLVHPDLRADFPPPRSLDARPHNLPLQLSSFVGREREIAQVGQLLESKRLVTLLGPGGIGKTRLALQVAAECLEHHPDGAFFVDLSPARGPDDVLATVASALGLRQLPSRSLGETITGHLRERAMLLVLDNLEQLLPAVVPLFASWLSTAPETRLLATSRAPLRIRGEHEYQVEPLAAGMSSDRPGDAVELFRQRAGAAGVDIPADSRAEQMVIDICARLDGLPLAIELAVPRLRLFTLPELRERLAQRMPLLTGGARDLPERQRTLRATVEWSEQLLPDGERRLFARLAVFAGGFSLEAAEAVAGDADVEVSAGVAGLLEQSLLRRATVADTARYTMLETVREYARERLTGSESEAVHLRHAEHFVALAERAAADLASPDQGAWLDALHMDRFNLAAAIEWAVSARRADLAVRMVAPIARYWTYRGSIDEAARLARLAAEAPGDVPPAQRAAGLRAAGRLVADAGDGEAGFTLLQEALVQARLSKDPQEKVETLLRLAEMLTERRDWHGAHRTLEEARDGLTGQGPRHHAGYWWCLGLVQLAEGDARNSRDSFGTAIDQAVIAGDRLLQGVAGYYRGIASLHAGDLDGARSDLETSLQTAKDFKDRFGILWAQASLAVAAVWHGDLPAAARSIEDVLGSLRDPAMAANWALVATVYDVVGRMSGPESQGAFWAAAETARRRDSLPEISPSAILDRPRDWPGDTARGPNTIDWDQLVDQARTEIARVLDAAGAPGDGGTQEDSR